MYIKYYHLPWYLFIIVFFFPPLSLNDADDLMGERERVTRNSPKFNAPAIPYHLYKLYTIYHAIAWLVRNQSILLQFTAHVTAGGFLLMLITGSKRLNGIVNIIIAHRGLTQTI